MSDNWYTPHSGKPCGDAAQINEHLNKMTADELIDELADKWDSMGELDYEPQLIGAYLNALDEKDPLTVDYSAESSLAAFREKHAPLFEAAQPAPKSSDPLPFFKPKHRLKVIRLAAAAMAMLLAGMISVQALGIDVFGSIARWTEDTFHFSAPAQTDDAQAAPDREYANLQEALNSYDIPVPVVPNWYPPGFERTEIKVFPTSDSVKVQAVYENGEKGFIITIRRFETSEDVQSGTFEKDNSSVAPYEIDGITHYILSNYDQRSAIWTNQNIMCSISGNLTEDELKQMINSIYER